MKKLGCPLAIVVAAGLIALVGLAYRQFAIRTEMGFESPMLFVSTGPGIGNHAQFVTSGFQDRGISLFVSPAIESQAAPVLVAHLEIDRNLFDSAVWSGDGTVIACRRKTDLHEDLYCYAYDFVQCKPLMPNGVSASSIGLGSPIDWHAHSSMVRQLIALRGGLGPQVTRGDIEAGSRKMDWTQWQAYKRKN